MGAPESLTTSTAAVRYTLKAEAIQRVPGAICTELNGLFFYQYQLPCLSLFSYLLGDESTGRAVVVDPQRDVSQYLVDAQAHNLRIERVIETHVHADFLSGHLELAAATGAVTSYSSVADTDFVIEPLGHGRKLSLGNVVLEIWHTPGHTPQSISLVVWKRGSDAAPWGVLTGDTLFIGDVGRPDLHSASGCTASELARQLYRSLHEQLLTLPDGTQVFSAHGSDSSCGHYHDLLDNRETPVVLGVDEVVQLYRDGAAVVDGRAPEAFALAHLRGSLNVGLDGRFAEYAGNVGRAGQPIMLVTDAGRETEARVRLARIGFDNVVGYLPAIERVLAQQPDLTTFAARLTVTDLAAWSAEEPKLQIVDVRNSSELAAGAVPGAKHISLPVLLDRMSELDATAPTAVYCAGGYRSSIAAAALRAAGFAAVADLRGGFGAWSSACVAVEADEPADPRSPIQEQHGKAPRLADKQRLTIHTAQPLNCETPIASLTGMVTSNADFYVRNHFHTPLLDPDSWRLHIDGLVDRPQALTLRDLYSMKSQTRVITLECAGNGRSAIGHLIDGVPWTLGAVGTAEWTGVPLVEVLNRAGTQPTAREVIFRGADSGAVQGRAGTTRYERSLTLDNATTPHVLLAYAMNGEPLPAEHGYPVRLIVPGWYGMAAVKWLIEISVTDQAFAGHYQAGSYHYEWGPSGQMVRKPVSLQRIRSLITEPLAGEQVRAGQLAIRGMAWSGVAPIARVEVRVGDRPWQDGQLLGSRSRYRWQPWELITEVDRGEITIKARATDLAGHIQLETTDGNHWGYGNNAIHHVAILGT